MSEPFAAYELVRRIVGNTEQEVLEAVLGAQRITYELLSRQHKVPSIEWLFEVEEATMGVIEARIRRVMAALVPALQLKPPAIGDQATAMQIAGFVMDDVGRYFAEGHRQMLNFSQSLGSLHGVSPDIRRNEAKMRERVRREIELVLTESGGARATIGGGKPLGPTARRKVLLVHGRNEEHRRAVELEITAMGFEPVVLRELPARGGTITDKFDGLADVDLAVIILSGDDEGRRRAFLSEPEPLLARPRQDVLLEFGLCLGRLGWSKVCVLCEAAVELPSEYDGGLYLPLDGEGVWRGLLRNVLLAAIPSHRR
ncbi:MAG: nucleotide-binding protein [Verrucomicrobia bacterium]|nr:nucleotide-binding protein [Verrucomicrobiota bacterium]